MKKIAVFQDEFRFLSNFWPSTVTFEGIEYTSVEHAYVAAKTTNLQLRKQIAACKIPAEVKKLGRKLKLRPNWDDVKISVMRELVREKFTRHPDLRRLLKDTGDAELIEGNWWGDTFWGRYNGVGQNWLGKILMEIRDEL